MDETQKKIEEINSRNAELAYKIALLLVESKARVEDIRYIFSKAENMLVVGSVEIILD